MNEFLGNLFKKEEKVPQRQPPIFYKREEDERVEVLHKLATKIGECDKKIASYKQQILGLDQRIKENKELYDRFKNKKSTQAEMLKGNTLTLMAEKEKLQKMMSNYAQQKDTATLHHDNLNSIVDVEEMNELTKMSTTHIEKAVGKIDLFAAKESAGQARNASKTAAQLTSYIINPMNLDPMENHDTLSDAFDKLDFGVDEELSEEYLYPVANKSKQPMTSKPKAMSSILDDELL